MRLTTKPKLDAQGQPIDPTGVYVAVDGFSSDSLPDYPRFAARRGTRLVGAHPAVQVLPHLWARDGVADDQLAEIRHRMVREAIAATPEYPDPHRTRLLGPVPDDHRLVATRPLAVDAGRATIMVNPGDVADDRDKLLAPYHASHFKREAAGAAS